MDWRVLNLANWLIKLDRRQLEVSLDSDRVGRRQQKAPAVRRGLCDSVDLNRFVCSRRNRLIPDQPIAGAWSATGVDSAAARSRGKL
jgi:hypothetical protein